jgi:hypothetical protein
MVRGRAEEVYRSHEREVEGESKGRYVVTVLATVRAGRRPCAAAAAAAA